ncbi:MAG: hypothetical protein VKO64_09540 [Candidatus Sericytochromatia bacterium]|nr:hypothetical protein [Candidatus Sericytochromatia bacterium]
MGSHFLLCLALLLMAWPGWAAQDFREPVLTFAQDEVSGIAASRRYPGVFWAIRDSGTGAREVLLAFRLVDGRAQPWPDGRKVREVRVLGVRNRDWEELAFDEDGHLWIADSGNNRHDRTDLALLRVLEPDPWRDDATRVEQRVPLRYPDAPRAGGTFNAEALFFHDGHGWLITKDAAHGLYRFPVRQDEKGTLLLERSGGLVPPPGGFGGLVTGAAIADGGKLLAVTAGRRHVWFYESSEDDAPRVTRLAGRPPAWCVAYGKNDRDWQVEAASFVPGCRDLVVAAEEGPVWFFPNVSVSRPRPSVR